MSVLKLRLSKTVAIASVISLGVALTSCSSSDAGAGSSTSAEGADGQCVIADSITIGMVNEQSGPVAYAGVGPREGIEIAFEEINESGFLGDGVTISLETADTGGEIERASSEMTQMLNNGEISAIIGPASSQSAAAVAPLANNNQVPVIYTQAGSEGVVIGDWNFRITPPTETYYNNGIDWLAAEGHDDVALIYNATYPTFAQLGQTHIPEKVEGHGMSVTSSQEVQTTTQDFTSQAQVIASENPSAVVMLLLPAASITFMNQLRDAGYEGQVLATPSQSGGFVSEGGASVDGIAYSVPFSPAQTDGVAGEFAAAFEAKYDKTPNTYNAEGYDAGWWIANAIKESGCSSPAGVQEGLLAVGATGFEGAQGALTFENGNDVRSDGVMVSWVNGAEVLVTEG